MNSDMMTIDQAVQARQNLRTVTGLAKGNATVTPEQHRKVLEDVVIAARKVMVARALLGSDIEYYNDLGIQTISYDTLTEMSAAKLDWKFNESQDLVNLTRTNVPVPILHKEFEIDARDVASSQRFGTPLNTQNAEAAAYRVAALEDTTILQGYARDGSTYEVAGFYQSAGNTAGGADFGTPGNGLTSVAAGIAMLDADNIKAPYNLVLHPTQYNELMKSIFTGGVDEIQKVQNMLQSGRVDQAGTAGGLILSSTDITAGTGLLVAAPGRGYYKYHLPMDLTTKLAILEKSDNLWGRVFIAGRLVVNDANSICSLTGI